MPTARARSWTGRELMLTAMSPFIAGMDTAAAMASYLLYDLLSHPDVLRQVVAEVNAHFGPARFTPEMFMAMPTLHAAAMETLRLHTIALAQPRVAVNDFQIGGYDIPKGARVMLSGAVAHFLPEFYKEPNKYDVTRMQAPRQEHRQKNAYAPYGIGAHLCLGAGVAEVQFPLNVALWLKHFELEMQPRDYTLKLSNNPTPHPSGFKVRIVKRLG
ncbi:MAG: cytochrome P450 [Anaerolineae bacterium]|nr:cytochrome P450 [Anaerolineae bacterium]